MPEFSADDAFTIIDLGSFSTKAGFADPLGLPTSVITTSNVDASDIIQRGQISNWDALFAHLEDILYGKLKILPNDESPILIAEPLNVSRADRERLSQLMFEEFNVPAFSLCEQALCSLFSHGKMSGLVVDVGHSTTEIVPIIEGNILRHAAQSIAFAGQDLDLEFFKILQSDSSVNSQLQSQGIPLTIEITRFIKDNAAEARTSSSTEDDVVVIFPDGKPMNVGSVRFEVGELLFNAALRGLSFPNLADACRNVVNACDVDKRRILLDHVVLTGGSTLMKGFRDRFASEFNRYLSVSDLMNEGINPSIRILSPPDYMLSFKAHPEWSSWVGASMVSRINFAQQQYVSRADYGEHGPTIIHVKLS